MMTLNKDWIKKSFVRIVDNTVPFYFIYAFISIVILMKLAFPDEHAHIYNEVENFHCNVTSYEINNYYSGDPYTIVKFLLSNCTLIEEMDSYSVTFNGLNNEEEFESYSEDKLNNGLTLYLYQPGDFISLNGEYVNDRKNTIRFTIVSNAICIVFYTLVDLYTQKTKGEYVKLVNETPMKRV